jgi:hypothetical protein
MMCFLLALYPMISEACRMSVVDLALYSGVYKSCLLFSRAFCHLITTHLFSLTTRLLASIIVHSHRFPFSWLMVSWGYGDSIVADWEVSVRLPTQPTCLLSFSCHTVSPNMGMIFNNDLFPFCTASYDICSMLYQRDKSHFASNLFFCSGGLFAMWYIESVLT